MQELFVRYGNAQWFEDKNLSYTDVDYASTRWRPDLYPLPCRQNVQMTTGEDGRHSFTVVNPLPAEAILDISPCVKVSAIAVDQFPFLLDFVLLGTKSKTVCACEDADAC